MFAKQDTQDPSNSREVTIALPFTGKLSKDIKKSLMRVFEKTALHVKLKVMFVSTVRLKNCFSFKDYIPNVLQSLTLQLRNYISAKKEEVFSNDISLNC